MHRRRLRWRVAAINIINSIVLLCMEVMWRLWYCRRHREPIRPPQLPECPLEGVSRQHRIHVRCLNICRPVRHRIHPRPSAAGQAHSIVHLLRCSIPLLPLSQLLNPRGVNLCPNRRPRSRREPPTPPSRGELLVMTHEQVLRARLERVLNAGRVIEREEHKRDSERRRDRSQTSQSNEVRDKEGGWPWRRLERDAMGLRSLESVSIFESSSF